MTYCARQWFQYDFEKRETWERQNWHWFHILLCTVGGRLCQAGGIFSTSFDNLDHMNPKGSFPLPKRMNFWKSSKRPLTPPPPHFRKIMLQIFWNIPWKYPLCIIFMPKKPCSKVQNLQQKFLDWKWPPPPFGTFPKIHPFWYREASLTNKQNRLKVSKVVPQPIQLVISAKRRFPKPTNPCRNLKIFLIG